MENEEKVNNDNKSEKKCCDTSGWNGPGMVEAMAGCCGSMSKRGDSGSTMARCMKMCRWFPLLPVIIGIVFLLLGYYLDAEITRVLWMAGAGLLILMGTFCLLMMSKMIKICRSEK